MHYTGRNLGLAMGCNLGLGLETLIFLNPDCLPGVGPVRGLVEVLDSDSSVGSGGWAFDQPGWLRIGGRPDLVFDHSDAARDLGFAPRAFGLASED